MPKTTDTEKRATKDQQLDECAVMFLIKTDCNPGAAHFATTDYATKETWSGSHMCLWNLFVGRPDLLAEVMYLYEQLLQLDAMIMYSPLCVTCIN